MERVEVIKSANQIEKEKHVSTNSTGHLGHVISNYTIENVWHYSTYFQRWINPPLIGMGDLF